MAQLKFAKKLRVSQQAVSGWIHGRSKPTLSRMVRVRQLLGIEIEAWADFAVPRGEAMKRTGTDG